LIYDDYDTLQTVKEKTTPGRIFQILLGIYAVLYLAYIILPAISELDIKILEEPSGRLKTILTFAAFILVYLLSWKNRDIAGMLLIVGYIGSILMDALLENLRLEAVILGFPVLIIGIFMVRDWYRQLLNLLASIYTLYQVWRTLTYFIVIIDIELIDQILITGLLSVWIFGFIFMWRRPAMAGWIFIIWFLFLLGTIITDRGGLEYPVVGVVIGLPGLILGILFILWGRKLKNTLPGNSEETTTDP
jgi:hypothetical protein